MADSALLAAEDDSCPAQDPIQSAENAGLRYVSDDEPGIRRKRAGRGFAYFRPNGAAVRDDTTQARIRALAVPPAYTDVWICSRADGHIQATGRDARGRKQYRYHPKWTAIRDETKYERLIEFAQRLPDIRKRVDADISQRGLGREKVLATVVHLLDTTLIRIGNEKYRRENRSFGLTTLRNKHVQAGSDRLRFSFKGKSGKEWKLSVTDRRIARVVRQCQDIPGQNLFQYRDDEGAVQAVTSEDVNDYIREIAGAGFSAKHFRTWAGTVTAAHALAEADIPDTKAAVVRTLNAAVDQVAERLVNTRAISRKCYIHPAVIQAYLDASLTSDFEKAGRRKPLAGLKEEEGPVLAFLQSAARQGQKKA